MTKSRKPTYSSSNEKDGEDSEVESINCCQLNVHKAKIRESRSKYHNYPVKRLAHNRSCTDLLFLIFFLACLAAWVYLGYYAIKTTPPTKIFAPTDSRNRRCGYDEEVKNKPNVFYFDILKCAPPRSSVLQCNTPRVCLAECPKENFYINAYLESYSMSEMKKKLICQDGFNKAYIKDKESALRAVKSGDCAEWYLESKPIYRRCLYDRFEMYQPSFISNYFNVSINHTKLSDLHVMSDAILSYIMCYITYNNDFHKSAVCSWLGLDVSLLLLVGNRCLPKTFKNTGDAIEIGLQNAGKIIEWTVNGVTGKQIFNASKAVADISKFGHQVFIELTKIWPWILIHIGLAVVISFIYIIIMRWISGVLIWASLGGSVALLLYSSYFTWIKFRELAEYEENLKSSDFQYTILGLFWKKEVWLGFFILSVFLLFCILVIILFLRKRIVLALELINEGSKAVISSWSAIVFPVFPWILQVGAIAYGVIIFAYLMYSGIPVETVKGLNGSAECVCSNNYKEGSYCDVITFKKHCHNKFNPSLPCSTAECFYSESSTQNTAIYFHLCNLLMVLWSIFFASGFDKMVLASVFCTYFWTFNKNDLPIFMVARGVWKVIRYHLGTISFGSFLLALCNWLRVLIEMLYKYLNKYDNNFVKFIRCCCFCFFWCLTTFLKFLNKNAYIMCAIEGKNFCRSARGAFNLLMRNVVKVIVLDKVTNFLFFLGKVMITTGIGLLAFQFFSNPVPRIEDPFNNENKDRIEYYFVPIIIICVTTYFIASLFLEVYSIAVDTLFLCALKDLEINDGSPEKPYFMSKDLMRILKKKNEIKVR